jgi:nucleotide-binding universal stress UspA family protein
MFEKVLLAVDGSEHAFHAARTAADLARTVNAKEFRILVAYDLIPPYLGEPNMQIAIDARMEEAKAIMQKAIDVVGNVPCEIHTEFIEGSPAEAIIDVATTRKSDVIVIGSRGHGTLVGLLLGSTSQKVVAHAPCPVLIVR